MLLVEISICLLICTLTAYVPAYFCQSASPSITVDGNHFVIILSLRFRGLDTRLVTSPATAKFKCKSKSPILKSKSKSTLSGQVQVRVQVLFQKAKSKSKSSMEKRTCKHFYSIPVFQYPIPELIFKYSWQVLI